MHVCFLHVNLHTDFRNDLLVNYRWIFCGIIFEACPYKFWAQPNICERLIIRDILPYLLGIINVCTYVIENLQPMEKILSVRLLLHSYQHNVSTSAASTVLVFLVMFYCSSSFSICEVHHANRKPQIISHFTFTSSFPVEKANEYKKMRTARYGAVVEKTSKSFVKYNKRIYVFKLWLIFQREQLSFNPSPFRDVLCTKRARKYTLVSRI